MLKVGVEPCLTKPKMPPITDIAERFNRRLKRVLCMRRLKSTETGYDAVSLQLTLQRANTAEGAGACLTGSDS